MGEILVVSSKAKSFFAKTVKDLAAGRCLDMLRMTTPGGVWMSWFLESPAEVDATYQLALKEGLTVTFPPTDEPWGVRECHIRHPDGHTFRVSAELEEES